MSLLLLFNQPTGDHPSVMPSGGGSSRPLLTPSPGLVANDDDEVLLLFAVLRAGR